MRTETQIQTDINLLCDEKDRLVADKRQLTAELANIKGKLATTLPQHQYQQVMRARSGIVTKLQVCENAIAEIKSKLRAIEMEKQETYSEKKGDQAESVDVIRELRAVRDKWQSFASDQTRVSSMRIIASQIVEDINPILKKLLAP